MLPAPVKMNIVPADTDVENMVKGDTIIYTRNERYKNLPAGSFGIISACPQCGFVAMHVPHLYNEQTQSATPSLKCLNCDYHGYLTNGFFTNT